MMLQVWSEEKAASGLQVGLVCSGQIFAQDKNKKNPKYFYNQKVRNNTYTVGHKQLTGT
jgi:hypothetical protein